MTASTLVIHLDGATPSLLERWSRDGHLPTLAGISSNGRTSSLITRDRLFPNSSWTELNTGRSVINTGIFHTYSQIRTGELRPRLLASEELPDGYWTIASRSGKRVAAIDPILAKVDPSFEGVLLTGWSVHDSPFGTKSQPESLVGDVTKRWGETRIPQRSGQHTCASTPHNELAEKLGAEASRKAGFAVELLQKEHWDLFICAFSELHCAGHFLWGEDVKQLNGADTDADDAQLLAAYRYVDSELGKIVEAAGNEATVIVISTGGIGPYFASVSLLSDIPSRLGMAPSRRLRMWVNKALPHWLYARLRRVGSQSFRNRFGLGPGSFFDLRPGDSTRVFPVYNGTAGAYRLNLVGREPHGTVRPGREADEILDELARELLDLRVDGSDEPLCAHVIRVADEFGPDAHDDLPDLIALTRTDKGLITACTSKKLGRLRQRDDDHPPGHHTGESQVWVAGPGVRVNEPFGNADVIDIAPTVLASLGIDAPVWMRGRSLISTHSV